MGCRAGWGDQCFSMESHETEEAITGCWGLQGVPFLVVRELLSAFPCVGIDKGVHKAVSAGSCCVMHWLHSWLRVQGCLPQVVTHSVACGKE